MEIELIRLVLYDKVRKLYSDGIGLINPLGYFYNKESRAYLNHQKRVSSICDNFPRHSKNLHQLVILSFLVPS